MMDGQSDMVGVYELLKARGFIEQVTDEARVVEKLNAEKIFCYIGFDPTAKSLHIGSLVPIMALIHFQRFGHRPIALVGGGTALIGDPSGKTEMRQLLSLEQIRENAEALKKQLSRYLDFDTDSGAMMVNNADWLTPIKYIEFLRDIGRHFSVNKMLAAESYRIRLEKGLNFIEFNYMLLQSYDFLHLFNAHGCLLQMGGNDQWGNILAGADLIRRVTGAEAFGMTFPLLTTSSGHKMGKTERGTVWLDAQMMPPYEYYQYWVNVEDADLKRFLLLFTFLPIEEIEQVGELSDAEINMAKAILAFETTKITHGEDAAIMARQTSAGAFGAANIPDEILSSSTIPRAVTQKNLSAMPFISKSKEELLGGIPAYKLFMEARLCSSASEARRLIAQGGGYINERQLQRFDEPIGGGEIDGNGEIILRKGKKSYALIKIV